MARAMVINYGFSEIGPFSLLDPSAQVRCWSSSHGRAVSWTAGRRSLHSPSPSTPAPSTMLASHQLLLLPDPLSLPMRPLSPRSPPCSPRT